MAVREKVFESPYDFRKFCKKLTTRDRKNVIKLAEKQHITWNTNDDFKINWMRCAMAINSYLKKGGKFIVPVTEELDVVDTLPTSTKKTNTVKESTAKTVQRRGRKKKEATAEKSDEELKTSPSEEIKAKPSTDIFEYRETPEGDLVFGEGFRARRTQFGLKPVPGHARILNVDNVKKLGGVLCVTLECAYEDKDMVQNELSGRFEPSKKCWYIPLSQVMDAIRVFKNVEVTRNIAPIIKRVLEIRTFANL